MSFTTGKSMELLLRQTRPVLLRVTTTFPRFFKTQCACNSSSAEPYDGPKNAEHAKHFPSKSDIMLPAGTFANKTAFITGGGTGLGRGMATVLSQLGAEVVITSRKLDVLNKTATEITQITGNQVYAVAADVRDTTAIKTAFDFCEAKCGLPHIVINNAAGNFITPTERLSTNAWKAIVGIDLDGTAYVTLEAGKRLIKAGQGAAFLAITTPYAQSGSGFVAPSAAAKSGIEALTKSLAAEWARYGMRFNCIAPGPIYTKGAFSRLDPGEMFDFDVIGRVPLGRIGQIAELANLATYLVSDYSNWINGQVIVLDGGEAMAASSTFNQMVKITNEQWDMIEAMIKSVKGS